VKNARVREKKFFTAWLARLSKCKKSWHFSEAPVSGQCKRLQIRALRSANRRRRWKIFALTRGQRRAFRMAFSGNAIWGAINRADGFRKGRAHSLFDRRSQHRGPFRSMERVVIGKNAARSRSSISLTRASVHLVPLCPRRQRRATHAPPSRRLSLWAQFKSAGRMEAHLPKRLLRAD
jgi:hypothetical protein